MRVRIIANSDYFAMSVCLLVRMKQLSSQWTDFHEIRYLSIFRKSIEKIRVSLKSDKNNKYFNCTPMNIYEDISLNNSKNNKSFRFKLYMKWNHTFVSTTFSRKLCLLWGNVENCGTARQSRDDQMVRRKWFACWIIKATHTH